MESLTKGPTYTVITHAGHHHADEVTAVATLRILLGSLNVIRVKESYMAWDYVAKKAEDEYIVVLDIGHRRDTGWTDKVLCLDHHHDKLIPCAAVLVADAIGKGLLEGEHSAPLLDILDGMLFGIDQGDRGLCTSPSGLYTISNVISSFSSEGTDEEFHTAVNFTETILRNELKQYYILQDSAKRIDLLLPLQSDNHIFITDENLKGVADRLIGSGVKFVIQPNQRGGYGLRTISKVSEPFKPCMPLNAEHCVGSSFFHTARFFAVFPTKELAYSAAKKHLVS